ncbi:kelch-like protein 20, partial [Patella vulgata]|uniref:kelch-like protein 20 n=1 Tax=Patella vulgata TaxID=6465 RepID=UPI00217FCF09
GITAVRDINQFLVDLWRNQQMCDLVLKVGRYELLAHKLALAAHSPQFAQQCIVEAPTGPCEICLSDTTVEATQEVLKYIYTKSITITDVNVDPVLSCVRQIGVKGALDKCRLLEDDNLNIERELDIYFIATNWLDYNRQERIKHTKAILNTVRFALIVPDDIVQYVEPNIKHYSEECGIMLTNVFSQACRMVEEYKSSTNSWHLLTKLPDTRHHHGVATLDGFFYLVGGYTVDEGGSSGPTNSCYRYSYTENYWSRTCDMEHARAYHGVAVLGGVLYALGGQDVSGRDLDSLEFYNPDTDAWAEATPLTECKRGVATIGYQGLLYCIGGFNVAKDKKSVLATVECFDPLQNV